MEDNEEQLAYINAPSTNGVLLGVPGAGKTLTLIKRCMKFQQHSSMILTFSREACEDFKRKVAAMCEDHFNMASSGHIRTIHSLCTLIVSKFRNNKTKCSMHTIVYRATQIMKETTKDEICTLVPLLKNIQRIMVDEAQDINALQYEFCIALQTILCATLELIGDPCQNIYQFQGGTDKFLRNHAGFSIQLCRNYRSSQAIVDLVNASRPYYIDTPMISMRNASFPKPLLISGNMDTIYARIIDIVKDHMSKGHAVAIIGPTSKSKVSYCGLEQRIAIKSVANKLNDMKIRFKVHYNETSEDGGSCREYGNGVKHKGVADPSIVHLYTCHGSKGLEFDVELLLNFHYDLMGVPKKYLTKDRIFDYRYLMYVSLSRPRDYLYMFHLSSEKIWQGYFDIQHLLRLEGDEPEFYNSEAQEAQSHVFGAARWSSLITKSAFIDEKALTEIEDIFDIDISCTYAGTSAGAQARSAVELPEYDQLAPLYGIWAENMFYHYCNGGTVPCVQKIQTILHHTVHVPMRLATNVAAFHRFTGYTWTESISWSFIEQLRTRMLMDKEIGPFMLYIDKYPGIRAQDKFCIVMKNPNCWFDAELLESMISANKSGHTYTSKDIWMMCLFLYQYENECRYRWHDNYASHIDAL